MTGREEKEEEEEDSMEICARSGPTRHQKREICDIICGFAAIPYCIATSIQMRQRYYLRRSMQTFMPKVDAQPPVQSIIIQIVSHGIPSATFCPCCAVGVPPPELPIPLKAFCPGLIEGFEAVLAW